MKAVWRLIVSDLYRYHGRTDWPHLFAQYFSNKGFYFSFWYRIVHHYHTLPVIGILLRLKYSRVKAKLVTDMNYKVRIGPGLCIYHLYGSSIHPSTVVGKNLVLMHGVTVGSSSKGTPTIGDNVFLGPGSLVFGAIRIGSDVAIGGNSVVTQDVSDFSVVVGNPSRVVSSRGSSDYVRNRVA